MEQDKIIEGVKPAETKVINSCPEFPYFGAPYPDAICVDGYLHDLDDSPAPWTVCFKG